MISGILFAVLLMISMVPQTNTCGPLGAFSSKQADNPYVEKRQPNVPEDNASGKFERAVKKDDKRLVRISSTQIEFNGKERDDKCRMATKACKQSLLTLADVVDTHWKKKYKLRVKYAYIEKNDIRDYSKIFKNKSLHLEGRAFDLQLIEPPRRYKRSLHKLKRNVNHRRNTRTLRKHQRRIDRNLPELAGLAYYQAEFSFVEVKLHHIHVSCAKSGKSKSKSRWPVFSRRCFPSSATVRREDGRKVAMKDLRVGERVLTLNHLHQPTYSEVSMIMDRQTKVKVTDYLRITTLANKTLTLSTNHLIPVRAPNSTQQEFIFSKDIRPLHHEVYVYDHDDKGGGKEGGVPTVSTSLVASVEVVGGVGAYAPLTLEGTIIVDDVFASCYASFPNHWVSHYVFLVWRTLYTLLSQLLDMSLYQSLSDGVHWYPNFFRMAVNAFPVLPYPL